LIEGLIILGIAAIVIVVALFGTTIISIGTSIVASISAMITGAVTGAANLLTSWYTWAIASDITNYYIGYIWLASWLSLFAYSGYKIATSDKKKWMNLVGRGSNYLGVILILFLVAQPLVVSFGASYLADTKAYTEIDYNVHEQVITSGATDYQLRVLLANTTATYTQAQTEIYDNSTKETVVASIVNPTVTTAISGSITLDMNTTFLATETVSKVVVTYLYVGTGNVTNADFTDGTDVKKAWAADLTNNASLTWIPETFQSNQIKTWSVIRFYLRFLDSSNIFSTGDYISISIHFYTTSTVFSQATIMFWLAVSIASLDIIGLLYATGVLQKYIL